MDFKTQEGVMEIFRSVNCIGNENCFFVTYKNPNREGAKYGLIGGALGASIAAVAASSIAAAESVQDYEALLINQTENGLGIIPLTSNGVQLVANVSKMQPLVNSFMFIPNESIEQIEVKNYNFLNKKVQKVNITIAGAKTLHQLAHTSDKNIPYQESNFARFMSKYKK